VVRVEARGARSRGGCQQTLNAVDSLGGGGGGGGGCGGREDVLNFRGGDKAIDQRRNKTQIPPFFCIVIGFEG